MALRRALLAGAVGAAALAVSAPAAWACDDPATTDAAGDVSEAYLDVTAGWFSTAGDDLYANIRVLDLQRQVPSGASAVRWSMNFRRTAGNDWRHVSARLTSGGALTFSQGHRHPDGQAHDPTTPYHDEAGVEGELVPGAGGIVRIKLRELTARDVGKRLDSIWVESRVLTGFESQVDSSPLSGDGPSWTIARCDGPPPAAGTTAAGTPQSGEGGTGVTVAGGSEATSGGAALDLRLVRALVPFGRAAAVYGQVSPPRRVRVELLAADNLRGERVVATTTTLDDGSFTFHHRPRADTNLRARVDRAMSPLAALRVQPQAVLRVQRAGRRTLLSGTVMPAVNGLVSILRLDGRVRRTVAVLEVRRGRFQIRLGRLGPGRLRAEAYDLVGVRARAVSPSVAVGR